jgi:hypothetical protein
MLGSKYRSSSDTKTVHALLEAGADVNAADKVCMAVRVYVCFSLQFVWCCHSCISV